MSKKLHILFLSGWYPSRVLPSNGNFVQRHAEAVATKHKVTLVHVVTDENINKKEIVEKTINNVFTKIVYVPKVSNSFFKFLFFLKTYLNEINAIESFDLTHLNITFPKGIIALYVKFFKKKPYIISEHWSVFLPEDKAKLSFGKKMITKFIVANAKYVICVSNSLKIEMLKAGYKGNYKVIGNIVNTKLFFPKPKKNQLFEIVHISTFNEESKNISGILSTIKKLSEIRSDFIFKIIGNTNNSELLETIKELNIPSNLIKVEGFKPPSEIATILQKANLYISFSNYETFGIVMIEALACGTPVISTNTGILIEMKTKKFISIIPKNNKEALLQSIINFLNCDTNFDLQQMHQLIEDKFSSKKIIEAYNQLYTSVLSSNKKLII
ncbi:Glycosyltransferase involved in cell wall bisynthesis [Lutibacter agarilyticus]|uniref:Glycosyltransferase involved in cell wall bisynthesis n=1 Tax=Lutibacter agarilyticus TaxID=1109740 RepID=A0A238WGQ5_9FLAO|nr:glycosyltransferase family 4 protein [Lutibacter agarilyticus]SNR45772.1 Glycosyltransferase involved in cell wall bisynthesis [Lutibacter agarilyticus]